MPRVAGILILQLVLAISTQAASAADFGSRKAGYGASHGESGSRSVEVIEDACRGAVVETARFKEQVCRHGVAGYAYCRWVDRQHDVRVPGTCGPRITTEGATPAKRGAFPPYPRG